jgi:hypothetical protein
MDESKLVVDASGDHHDNVAGDAAMRDGTVAAAVASHPNEESKSRLEDSGNLDHILAAPVLVEARGEILDYTVHEDFVGSNRQMIPRHRRHHRRRDHHADDLAGSSPEHIHHVGPEPSDRSNYGEERQPYSEILDRNCSLQTSSEPANRERSCPKHRFIRRRRSRQHETCLETAGLPDYDGEDGDDYRYKRRKQSHSKGRIQLAAHSVQREFAQQVSQQLVALEQTYREAMRERDDDDDVKSREVDDECMRPGRSFPESNNQSGMINGYDGDGDDDDSSTGYDPANQPSRRK